VAHLERTFPNFCSAHEPGFCQVVERGAEHLFRYPRNLAAELSKATRAISNRRKNDCSPASTERRQGDVDAAYVQPVSHGKISLSCTNQLVSSFQIIVGCR